MVEIYLPTIGIKTKSENNYLIDYGFVPSIIDQIAKIYVESMGIYGLERFLYSSDFDNRTGMCLYVQEGRNRVWYIFQIHVNENVDTFTRGYLETRVLHGIGKLNEIEDSFKKLQIYLSLENFYDFKKCSETQRNFVATLGGLYTMLKKELKIENLPKYWTNDQIFSLALEYFTKK